MYVDVKAPFIDIYLYIEPALALLMRVISSWKNLARTTFQVVFMFKLFFQHIHIFFLVQVTARGLFKIAERSSLLNRTVLSA